MKQQTNFRNYYLLLIISITLALGRPAHAQDTGNSQVEDQLHLTAAQLENFNKQAKSDVMDFGGHVEHIASKNYSVFLRRKYIGNALELFSDPDENIIEVTSLQPPYDKRSILIKDYLNGLLKLSYAAVNVTWYNFKISQFEKGPDGNYYATATVFQKFTATTGSAELKRSSRDIVKKSIQVKLIKKEAFEGANKVDWWEIKLADIHVEEKLL